MATKTISSKQLLHSFREILSEILLTFKKYPEEALEFKFFKRMGIHRICSKFGFLEIFIIIRNENVLTRGCVVSFTVCSLIEPF